jgi:hypothetical protein
MNLGAEHDKAVHCVGILHYGWTWNLAFKLDGTTIAAKTAIVGCVLLPWFSTGTNGAWDFR